MLGPLVAPALADLAARLRSLGSLSAAEQAAVRAGAATAIYSALWQRLDRVIVLELNAARLAGTLPGSEPANRWQHWVARLEQPQGWESLAAPYPSLLSRVRRLVGNRCAAALQLARRFAADRAALASLLGTAPGELREVSFGAGDSHEGGQTVCLLRATGGRLVYKPRSLVADATLATLLPRLLPDEPAHTRIRVPAVLARRDHAGAYGWAEHVSHRYCAGREELQQFYRGLGQWLAVMRLLGGSDLHYQNLVAAGPVPVVVDCETLFTPHHGPRSSGYGDAVDLAADRVRRSVLRTGLLPGRGTTLGWRGADWSAAGGLPGEQPAVEVTHIVALGTDQPRLATAYGTPVAGANHPSPRPDLHEHWPLVADSYLLLNRELRQRDRAGSLAPLLAAFDDCPVRVVLRDTAAYAALERMLWHPKALHEPDPARNRAHDLLTRQARNLPGAPDDPAVIAAEIDQLLVGDVPTFLTTPASGVMEGPGRTRLGQPQDLRAAALAAWRAAAPTVDRQVIQAALVGAYLNAELTGGRRRVQVERVRAGELEPRRRSQAAAIMRQLARAAIRGRDGTVTWVAPCLDVTGWAVRPLGPDLYDGLSGVAVLLAAYQREMAAGRADPLETVPRLLAGTLATLRRTEDQQANERAEAAVAGFEVRPPAAGGYLGLGSRIWAWLLLGDLGALGGGEAQRRAAALADLLPEALSADESWDLLSGTAGAVVPLLRLAARTGQPRWQQLALRAGRRLLERCATSGAGAYWPSRAYPQGVGGVSHGVTGFGWALARLALATGETELAAVADAAFAHEQTYYDPRIEGWRDSRLPTGVAVAWCHGSVGIGAVAYDLLRQDPRGRGEAMRDLLHRAAHATWPGGFGSTHTLCHGDMSAWEVLRQARAVGLGPDEPDHEQLTAQILTSLEEHGPAAGLTRDAFTPALMSGLGGAAYQLLRMHPDADLPSLLLPDPGGPDERPCTPAAAGVS